MFMKWFKAAGIRALKTVAQTAFGMVIVGQAIYEIDWIFIASVSAVSGISSILMSIKGLPELDMPECGDIAKDDLR